MTAFLGYRRRGKLTLGAFAALVYVFLYVPIVILFIYAFNSASATAWPPGASSLHWFHVLLRDPDARGGFINSVKVALTATVLALLLGTPAAFAMQRFRFPGRESLSFAIALPILLPGVITGFAMTTWFATLIQDGILGGLSLLTVAVGHAAFCLVLVFNNVLARLRRTTHSLEEASADLGADGLQTFWYVTLPAIRGAVIAGALLAFTLSFNEIVVTFFLIGAENTLPLWILSNIRQGLNIPEIDAASAVIISISVPIVLVAHYLARDVTGLGRDAAEP